MGVRSIAAQDLVSLVAAVDARTPRAPQGAPQQAPVQPEAKPEAKGPPGEDKIKTAAKAANVILANQGTGVRLRVDQESSQVIVQLINDKNEVIKQIPPEEMLQIAARMRELEGMLFNKQA
ncbi:MAG: flagellar protein FlaG [Candidatus Hydrogenedentes bacterium]|nr:flagellar protein FlaG [Candidatus Hydrogenedentota bacterium]